MRKILLIFAAVILFGALGFIYQKYSGSRDQTPGEQPQDYIEYSNIKYGYAFSYPSDFQLREWPGDYPSPDIRQADSIVIYPVNPKPEYSPELKLLKWPEYYLPASEGVDLLIFAQAIRDIQAEESNPNIEPIVGDLEETMIAGKKAYRFSLTDAFTLKSMDGSEGGYTLADDVWVYIFENDSGAKMVLHFSKDDGNLKRVFESIEFLE